MVDFSCGKRLLFSRKTPELSRGGTIPSLGQPDLSSHYKAKANPTAFTITVKRNNHTSIPVFTLPLVEMGTTEPPVTLTVKFGVLDPLATLAMEVAIFDPLDTPLGKVGFGLSPNPDSISPPIPAEKLDVTQAIVDAKSLPDNPVCCDAAPALKERA